MRAALDTQPDWSDLPVIILKNPNSHTRLVSNFATYSSVSLIPRPLKIPAFIGLVRFALENRLRQFAIADLLRAEEALRISEQRFRQLADAMPQLVWTADPHGNVDFYNARYREYRGIELKPDGTYQWSLVLHPEDKDSTLNAWHRAYETGEIYEIEHRVKRADGNFHWHLSRAVPVRDDKDKIIKWFGTATDIENVKRTEKSLRQLNQSLEQRIAERTFELEKRAQLLQRLSLKLSQTEDSVREHIAQLLHDDLQQHLAAVKLKLAMIQPLDKKRATNENLCQCIHLLDEAIQKTRKMSYDLRPPALRRSGLLPSLDFLISKMKEHHCLEITLTQSPEAEPGNKDVASFLYQALQELLFNVAKHSNVKTASIDAFEKDGWIVIRVADSGKGADLDQVYAHRGEDCGFGLFSIEERIHALGGHMSIETTPGNGWTTTLSMPRVIAGNSEKSEADNTQPAPYPSGKKKTSSTEDNPHPENKDRIRILVVDDHIVMREGLANLLNGQNDFQVIGQAQNGHEAVEMTMESVPDIILMDVNMPGMDGIEATMKIISGCPGICIIGLSMYDDDLTRQSIIKAGASDFLSKSDESEKIIQTIRKMDKNKNLPNRVRAS
jgi:PAS domain S-box-containing protein